jgi:hypothetical protein
MAAVTFQYPLAFVPFPHLHLQGSRLSLNDVDAEEPDVSDLKLLPDISSLADKLKGCLQVGHIHITAGGWDGMGLYALQPVCYPSVRNA